MKANEAIVKTETLTDDSVIFNVLLNGEIIATPETEADANAIVGEFVEHEKKFEALTAHLATCRAFIAKHGKSLAGVRWSCWGWDPEIKFSKWQNDNITSRRIACLFGHEGWRRVADGFTCGQFNWVKELDGIKLIIEGAESVKPQIKEEVRLSPVSA